MQALGIDVRAQLSNERIYRIDAKLDNWDTARVVLEYLSCEERGTPGWVERDLPVDYVAVLKRAQCAVAMLSWPSLRFAWKHCGEAWRASAAAHRDGFYLCRTATARAGGGVYHSAGVAVSLAELRRRNVVAGCILVADQRR